MKIKIEISVGELLDKISILIIKKDKIEKPEKLTEIKKELKFLEAHGSIIRNKNKEKYDEFLKKLVDINSKLWKIEDDIRVYEKNSKFDHDFVTLAREVYFTNDERFSCKNEINSFYGSEINEVKEYVDYKNNLED
jgi:SET domain-containing protein